MHSTSKPQRIVVKIGTSIITGGTPNLDPRGLLEIVRQIVQVYESGISVVVVSSGAITAGRDALNDPDLGRDIPAKQMLSAIGQPRLMHQYADLFAIFGLQVAQILLTRSDLANRQRYLNARDTLNALMDQRVITIANENDTTATDEIKVGDNDNLSALVANLIDADLLILLTDQPGLYTTDPRSNPDAKLINNVEQIDDEIWQTAGGAGSRQGTGGMRTKLQAAQLATRSGSTVVIARGTHPNILLELLGPEGRSIGTWFESQISHIESRKRWMLSEQPQGRVYIDKGAVKVLRKGAASLLPVGMTRVTGDFERGVVISVYGSDGTEVARGLTNYPSTDLERICGLRSHEIQEQLGYSYGDEVVHRDHLVMV